MKPPFKKRLIGWVYQQDVELINSPHRSSMDFFIVQVVLGNMFAILTGGEFLSGYALYLGASDDLMGYIPLIGSISGITLMFFGIIMERFTHRRRLVVVLNSITKPLLVSIILIPFFVPKPYQVLALFIILFITYIINAFLGLAVNSWFVKAIPIKIRGRYFSIRQIYAVLVMVLIPVIAGSILDSIPNRYNGFMILYGAALIFAIMETFTFSKIEDVTMESLGKSSKFLDIFKVPLKNKDFTNYALLNLGFHVTLYLSASFTQVFMLRYLELSYTFITSMTMLNAVLQIFAYSRWGRIADRKGNAYVMNLSYIFHALHMGLWALVSAKTMYVFIPLVYAVASFSSSGFMVGSFNYRYEIIPEKGRSLYDAFYSVSVGITLLIMPWIGGRLKNLLSSSDFVTNNIAYGEFRILFFASSIGLGLLGLISMFSLRKKMAK